MIHALSSLLVVTAPILDTPDSVVFKKMCGMVGGEWVGTLGQLTLKFRYQMLEDGKMIEGDGSLYSGERRVAHMSSRFGWDPLAKQVYYIDFHGHDTVYSGHVTLKDEKFVFDFHGLVGDMGHWISYAVMPTKDDYQFDMFEEKKGKMVSTHMNVKLHRTSHI